MAYAMEIDRGSMQARQFVRREASYNARFEVHPDHADQFRLSFPDAQRGLTVVDVSEGGLGLNSSVFIPRNIRLLLHVSGMEDEQGRRRPDAVIPAVVRRCTMLDHKPTYGVGLQYLDPTGIDELALVSDASRRNGSVQTKSAGGAPGAG